MPMATSHFVASETATSLTAERQPKTFETIELDHKCADLVVLVMAVND